MTITVEGDRLTGEVVDTKVGRSVGVAKVDLVYANEVLSENAAKRIRQAQAKDTSTHL